MSDTTAIILKRNAQHREHAGHDIGYVGSLNVPRETWVRCSCGERLTIDMRQPDWVLVSRWKPLPLNPQQARPGTVAEGYVCIGPGRCLGDDCVSQHVPLEST